MKLDIVIDHTKTVGMEAFGIDSKRAEEVQQFIDGIFKEMLNDEGISKPMVVQRCIEFANNIVEACLVFGFIEHRFMAETQEERNIARLLKRLKQKS